MLITTTADWYPNQCIVTKNSGELIDTGQRWEINHNYDELHIYLSKGLVEGYARDLCGMVDSSEVEEMRERLRSYAEEMVELREQVERYENVNTLLQELETEREGATNGLA